MKKILVIIALLSTFLIGASPSFNRQGGEPQIQGPVSIFNGLEIKTGTLATGSEDAPDVDAGGICLDQNALDNNILTFKSSDVAHGVTDYLETDTYAEFSKFAGDDGGLSVTVATEQKQAFSVSAIAGTAPGASAYGVVDFNSALKNGATITAIDNAQRIFTFSNNSTPKADFKGNGDFQTDGDHIVDGGLIGITGDLDLISMAATDLTVNGDTSLTNAGGDSNSYKLKLEAHMTAGGETQTSSMYTAWGLDPYLVIAVPNATGVETNTLHIDHNSLVFATDDTVDIGATGANRPKDIFMAGDLEVEAGAITASGSIEAGSDLIAGDAVTATAGNVTATVGDVVAGDDLLGRFAAYSVIPIEWCLDGEDYPPAAAEEITAYPGAVMIRAFAGTVQTENVICPWHVPENIVAASGIKFMVTGILHSAAITAEGLNFKLAGDSLGTNDPLACTFGAEVETEITGLTAALKDIFHTPYSGVVTVDDLAANEMAMLHFERDIDDANDDYEQDAGVIFIVIKYEALTAGF